MTAGKIASIHTGDRLLNLSSFPLLITVAFLALTINPVAISENTEISPKKSAVSTTETETKTVRLTIRLRDGSLLLGVTSIESISLRTSYATMKVPLKLIASIDLQETPEKIFLHMKNGDLHRGVTDLVEIPLQTLMGKVSVSLEHISLILIDGGLAGPPSLREGLVLYYSFDQDHGERVTDQSGKGNHGTVHGAGYTSDGKSRGAYMFDGKNSYINVPSIDGLRLGAKDNATFSFWWKAHSLQGDEIHLLSKRSPEGMHKGLYLALAHGSQYYLPPQGYRWAKFTAPLSTNKWHHAVFVKQGISWKIFHNGSQLNLSQSLGWPFEEDIEEDVPFRIGRDPTLAASPFNGLMDEIRIYNRALSEDEISEFYPPGTKK
jgi:hypothetical protein